MLANREEKGACKTEKNVSLGKNNWTMARKNARKGMGGREGGHWVSSPVAKSVKMQSILNNASECGFLSGKPENLMQFLYCR